jgi:hypothetical protein
VDHVETVIQQAYRKSVYCGLGFMKLVVLYPLPTTAHFVLIHPLNSLAARARFVSHIGAKYPTAKQL